MLSILRSFARLIITEQNNSIIIIIIYTKAGGLNELRIDGNINTLIINVNFVEKEKEEKIFPSLSISYPILAIISSLLTLG